MLSQIHIPFFPKQEFFDGKNRLRRLQKKKEHTQFIKTADGIISV